MHLLHKPPSVSIPRQMQAMHARDPLAGWCLDVGGRRLLHIGRAEPRVDQQTNDRTT
ncbi:hypothetical protein [Solihabitans fulvus]|uniref:hypothetical protein n=1 Tax=Solihabitans fulvus TaxID=1892852 RepID=UPI001661D6CF|nr:hypothetical protein [Solihabitans fulvus]